MKRHLIAGEQLVISKTLSSVGRPDKGPAQWGSLPPNAQQTLLEDAIDRDRTTARRACLLRILWRERFLTREDLIARVDGELGKGCFGKAAWDDTFYRDVRVVKQALKADGYRLAYSRSKATPGYYLRGEPRLHANLARALDSSVADVDPAQIAIYHHLSPADRFRQGCSISDTARRAVAYRLQQRQPELSAAEAFRLVGAGQGT